MKKAVAYARYSSFNQNEISIDAQIRAIDRYAAAKKITIEKIYTDEARSATNDSRPSFLRMIADLDSTRPDLVLVHKLDRFARNRIDAALYRKEIQDVGARLVAVEQDFGDGPEAVLMEALLEGNAEWFSKNLSKEVKKGQFEAVTVHHTHCGGKPPLGYNVHKKSKKYMINKHEAAAVRLIFQRKLEGRSYSQIMRELNDLGYRTKKGRVFGSNSLHDILRNEKYIGTYVYRKTSPHNSRVAADPLATIRVEGALPAIIDKETFYKVQELMDGQKVQPKARSETVYLLTGLARCPECGQALVGGSELQKGRQYEYYRCNHAKRTSGAGCGNRVRYNKKTLEQDVLAQIRTLLDALSGDQLDRFVDEVYKDYLQALQIADAELAGAKRELHLVQRELDNLVASIAAGVDASVLAPTINDLGRKKEALKRKTESGPPQISKESVRSRVEEILKLSFDADDPVVCRQDLNEILGSVVPAESAAVLRFKQFGIVR